MTTTTTPGGTGARKRPGRQGKKCIGQAEIDRLIATIDPLLGRVLRLIGEERAVPVDLFAPLLKTPAAAIESVLAEGVSRELLLHKPYLWYDDVKMPEPAWYWMTVRGLRVAGVRHSYYFTPSEKDRWHSRGLLKVRLHCEREWPKRIWLSERGVIDMFGRTSRRSPLERSHTVDGALKCGNGKTIGIEYERTNKDPYRVLAHMEDVLQKFSGAYYFCSDETRHRIEHIKRANGFRTIQVFPEPTFPGIA